MRLIIVTGMSGAGKSTALKFFEDMGFYCVDNLPILLIEKFAELTLRDENNASDIALGIDAAGGSCPSCRPSSINGGRIPIPLRSCF